MNITELQIKYDQIKNQMQLLYNSEPEGMSEENQAKFDELNLQATSLENQIRNAKSQERLVNAGSEPLGRITKADDIILDDPAQGMKSYTHSQRVSSGRVLPDHLALSMGHYIRSLAGDKHSDLWLQQNIPSSLHSEGTNSTGGYFVYGELSSELIRLIASYGVALREPYSRPMVSETLDVPRRVTGLTATWTGEGEAITESTAVIDLIRLIARKLAVLCRFSGELFSDSVIELGNFFAIEASWAIAKGLDDALFVGDGTSTYGGIYGICSKLSTINGVDQGGGLILAAGNLWSEITLPNLVDLISICPDYAMQNAKWYCSSQFYGSVLCRLMYSASGTSQSELVDGIQRQLFLSFPVVTSPSMPTSEANSQICCLFGDMRKAVSVGYREQIAIEASNSAYINEQDSFSRDLLAFRAKMRGDINCHDVGDDTTAGPVVGLITAAS